MSNLAKELKEFQRVNRGPRPVLDQILEALTLDEAKDLTEAIYDRDVSVKALMFVLEKRGFTKMNPSILMNYRHGRTRKPDAKYFK